MDPVESPPGKEKNPPRNAARNGRLQQLSESRGGELSSSIAPSWSLGRPRSRLPQERTISSQDGTLYPSGLYRCGDIGRGGPGAKGMLGSHPNSWQQSVPPFLPPKKRVLKSPQDSQNEQHNSSMESGKTPQIQQKRTSMPPLPHPAKTGSIPQIMIAKSAHLPHDDFVVNVGMRPHSNSGQSLKMTQLQRNKSPAQTSLSSPPHTGLGFQVKTMSAQPSHKDSDGDVSLRPNNNSRDPLKVPQVQPNKTSEPSSLSSPQNTGLRFHATDTTSAQGQLKGFDDDVSMRPNDKYSSQSVKMPDPQPKKSSGPPYLPPRNTGLRSNVMIAASVQPRLECSNVDVRKRKSDGQDNDLSTLMNGWKFARKRFHSTKTLASVEEVGNVTPKKTRLDWGEGLAKYEQKNKEKGLINAAAMGVNGDLSNNSTKITKMVVCPDIVPAFSCGSSPSHAISDIGDPGSSSLPSGTNGDLDKNSSSMTEKAVCQAASGCNPPQVVVVSGDPGNSSTNMTPLISCQGAPLLPYSNRRNTLQGAKCDILSTSTNTTKVTVSSGDHSNSRTRTTETVACPDIVPAITAVGDLHNSSPPSVIGANGDFDCKSSSMTEKAVCPAASDYNPPQVLGVFDDLDNSTTEKVVFPAANGSNLPQGVCHDLGNSTTEKVFSAANDCIPPRVVRVIGDPGNSSKNLTQTIACRRALASSHRRNASQGAKCDILSTNRRTTEAMVCQDDVPAPCPSQGENSDLANRSMRVIETVLFPATVPSEDRSSLPPGGSFSTSSTTIQDVPHKLATHGRDKIESISAPPPGIVLDGEIIAPPHQRTISPITTSNQDFSWTLPKIEGSDLRNLNDNRSSDDKIKKDGSFDTSAIVQDIPPISQGTDKIESSSAASQRILLASKIFSSPQQGPYSHVTAANTDVCLTIPKVEGPDLRYFTENRTFDVKIKKDEQEWKSGTNGISVCNDSTNCIAQSCSMLDGDESKTATNADCTTDGEQKSSGTENPELFAASNEANDGMMQSNVERPKSDKECGIVNNGSELGENGLVQQYSDDMGAMELDTNDNDNNIRRDEINPQHCVVPGEISGTVSSCIVDSMDVDKIDTIPISQRNEIIEPQQQISNKAPRVCQLSSTPGPSALQTVSAKSFDVKFDVDLNLPLSVASVDFYSSQDGASIGVNTSRQTTQIDLNIPDPASADTEPANNFNLGAKVELAHDFSHIENYLQSQTNMPEIEKDLVNQPGCFVLFGKVIFQAPSSEVKHASMPDNQIHGCSRDMISNMTVPFMTRDGQSYLSGSLSTWTPVPIDSYRQSMFSNQMPYGLISGSAAWPFQSGRSAIANWRQMPHLNLIPHSMTRGGVVYDMGARSRSSNLLNFDPRLPDTGRPQESGLAAPSRTNGEGSSTSNTRKGKERIT